MSDNTAKFWESFQKKDIDAAQKQLGLLQENDVRAVLSELYQKSQFHCRPIAVSALKRTLHEEQSFDDFYEAWFPAENTRNPVEESGAVFQQHFPVPVRVINGVNIGNSKELLSIGITWVRSQEEEKDFWDYIDNFGKEESKDNKNRRESIEKVADGEHLGLFRVKSDDNLGTPF
jgi:hypothetical protein